MPGMQGVVSGAAASTAGRPPVERPPVTTITPGGRPVPPDDLNTEVQELAMLLVDVVLMARHRAVFPSRLATIAELALEHDSVRQALAADGHEP